MWKGKKYHRKIITVNFNRKKWTRKENKEEMDEISKPFIGTWRHF